MPWWKNWHSHKIIKLLFMLLHLYCFPLNTRMTAFIHSYLLCLKPAPAVSPTNLFYQSPTGKAMPWKLFAWSCWVLKAWRHLLNKRQWYFQALRVAPYIPPSCLFYHPLLFIEVMVFLINTIQSFRYKMILSQRNITVVNDKKMK